MILLPLVDWTESAVVFVARTFDMIWICAPLKIVKDTSVHPRVKITKSMQVYVFALFPESGIDYIIFMEQLKNNITRNEHDHKDHLCQGVYHKWGHLID